MNLNLVSMETIVINSWYNFQTKKPTFLFGIIKNRFSILETPFTKGVCKLAIFQEILQKYNHLLALDDDDDQEKAWLRAKDDNAHNLSTSHFHILSYLLAQPNVSAKQISNEFNILPGTLSKRLALLVKRGLVVTQADLKDARYKRYSLTKSGTQVARFHEELLRQKNAQLTKALRSFDQDELQTITRFLTTVTKAEENMHYK